MRSTVSVCIMNEGIHLDLDTWIVPGQIRKANLCRGLGNRYTPAGTEVLISATQLYGYAQFWIFWSDGIYYDISNNNVMKVLNIGVKLCFYTNLIIIVIVLWWILVLNNLWSTVPTAQMYIIYYLLIPSSPPHAHWLCIYEYRIASGASGASKFTFP